MRKFGGRSPPIKTMCGGKAYETENKNKSPELAAQSGAGAGAGTQIHIVADNIARGGACGDIHSVGRDGGCKRGVRGIIVGGSGRRGG